MKIHFAQARVTVKEEVPKYDNVKCHFCENITSCYSTTYDKESNVVSICNSCIAIRNREYMDEHKKVTLYLVLEGSKYVVTNWHGSLKIPVDTFNTGNHNIADSRTDVWFTDYRGVKWWGVNYGSNNQICHCKKLGSK